MGLIQRLFDKTVRVENVDAVTMTAVRSNGEYYVLEDVIIAQDPSKVRMSRLRTEFNDVCVPFVEDPKSGVESATTYYRRRIIYVFGIKFSDEPILENRLEYKNGETKIREVIY